LRAQYHHHEYHARHDFAGQQQLVDHGRAEPDAAERLGLVQQLQLDHDAEHQPERLQP
jgi:hypothetical protein